MQLVAYGAQDIYLTGNPQITFFKVVYRRHTNFAMESIVQNFEGKFDFGRKCSVTISRNGDLVHKVWVEVGTKGVDGTNNFAVGNAFSLIDEVELEIGGQLIDRHFGDWMNIWTELTHSDSKADQLSRLVDQRLAAASANKHKLYIPLQFSFCRNPGLAIPLIALQYHEVKLHFRIANKADVETSGSATLEIESGCCYCDYIYLDTDERRRFAQTSHEYLIEQVQSNRGNAYKTACVVKHVLNFNHPVKELVWVHVDNSANKFAYVDNASGTAAGGDLGNDDAVLKLNGHDRFSKRPGDYFKNVQRYQHHSGAKKIIGDGTSPIYVYSFALQPEEHQPSGTCNFSRIDNALLEINSSGSADCTDIYAVSYNVLRVMSGMGGLAYSN